MEDLAEIDSFGFGSDSGYNGSILDQTTANEVERAAVGSVIGVPDRSCNGSVGQNMIHSLLMVEATGRSIGVAAEKVESGKMKVACSTKNLLRSCVVLKMTMLLGMHGGNTGRNCDGVRFGCTWLLVGMI